LPVIGGWRHARGMRPDLRAELLDRADRDQAARGMPEPEWETVASVDAGNLVWLKEVVAEVGWPGRSAVGEDGAHAAWLLAQHADSDPAFQRKCLGLVTHAAACGEASSVELAYLTDRVLLAAMGLDTLADNMARMAAEYGLPKPANITCAECASSIEVWLPEEGEAHHIRCAACGWTTTASW